MKQVLTAIWDFLIEIGEARQAQLRKTGYKGWY
jgi:hypothetical protein